MLAMVKDPKIRRIALVASAGVVAAVVAGAILFQDALFRMSIRPAMPPSTYFWFSERVDDLIFLGGPDDSNRVARYVRTNTDGEPGDYWLGLPSITSVEQLCLTLFENAGNGWVIVDVGRLYSTWAFYPDFKLIIVGASREEYRGPNGVLVYAIRAADNWSDDAKSRCAG